MGSTPRECLDILANLRARSGGIRARGLETATVQEFLNTDPQLAMAIQKALPAAEAIETEFPGLLALHEDELIAVLQERFCNFYGPAAVKPYVPLSAEGPWIITSSGAVIYNVGSYGMLSFGHSPELMGEALRRDYVMANIMTASFSQKRFTDLMMREIGHSREACPYTRFVCLNSGSEVVTLATIFSDVNAKVQTDPGGRHQGKKIMLLSLQGSFHGRTGNAARLSDSSAIYYSALASFRDQQRLLTIPVNDCAALEAVFARAEKENIFIESFFMEPVMGEGNPGKAVEPEFYALARRLTKENGTLLAVDSIQAAFRCHGCLSIVDYPGFESLESPDMETFSKTINGGQFPVSVLAITEPISRLYTVGIYGNTMTANPRGLEVIIAMMEGMTPVIRRNIVERGREMLGKLRKIQEEFSPAVTGVQGVGMLLSLSLDPAVYRVAGFDSLENFMRCAGINVIHGGRNALRFTPCFTMTSREVDLVINGVRDALANGPRIS